MPRKADLVKAIADESGISRKEATAAFNAFVSYLSESVKPGETVSIPGLGNVTITGRKPLVHSVRTVRIPAKKMLRFRAGKSTNDALKIFTDTYKKL